MRVNEDNPREDDWLLHWIGVFGPITRRIKNKPWKIGLAVSGGSDSMAMLHLFAQCADEHHYRLKVATVDHGLRPEAADEAAFVADTCTALGFAHWTLKWTDWDGKGNLQAAARDARYKLLATWAHEEKIDTIAIGHTTNDQAETFLARIARGSGVDGLAGMENFFHRHGIEFGRPLLSLEREMLRRYLRRHDYEWRDDPSNEDTKYQRVVARKTLKALEPLGIDESRITSTMFELSRAKRALREITEQAANDIVKFQGGDVVIAHLDFVMTNYEIKRRLLSLLLQWVGHSEYPPRADAVETIMEELYAKKPRTLNGCVVLGTKNEIRICREMNAVSAMASSTNQIWDNRWQLSGPHAPDLEIRALGPDGLPQCPDWRSVGLPRTSLLSSPSIWRGGELIAAPLAKLNPEWTATLMRGEKQFFSSIVPH